MEKLRVKGSRRQSTSRIHLHTWYPDMELEEEALQAACPPAFPCSQVSGLLGILPVQNAHQAPI
jgi:hypothetical protein